MLPKFIPVNGHLGNFQFGAFLITVTCTYTYKSFYKHIFNSLASIPRSGITRPYYKYVINFLRNFPTVF